MTDEVSNAFGLPDEVGNSLGPYNQFGLYMVIDPGSDCLYSHFKRFNLSMNMSEGFCYFLDEERSNDDAHDACAYHKYNAQTYLTQETHFRLAEGKTHSKPTIR